MRTALDFTHEILQDMGAVVAPNKSFLFSNSSRTNKWFAVHEWKVIKSKIPVVKHGRDLGGSFNTLDRQYSGTINQRLVKAIEVLRKIRFLPHDAAEKAFFVKAKVLPMALYGIESAEPAGHLMAQLQTAMVEALGAHSARRCNALVFEWHGLKTDLDPHVNQFVERANTCRRMWAKHPEARDTISRVHEAYVKLEAWGSHRRDETPSVVPPAPPPGHPGRAKWKPKHPMMGPIGLLLFSIAQVGASACGDFNIISNHANPIGLFDAPAQHIKPMLQELATDARLAHAATQRTSLEHFVGLDREVFKRAISTRVGDERRQLHHLCTLSSWDNSKLFDAGQADNTICDLCSCVRQTTDHLLYCCSALEEQRTEARSCFGDMDLADLPMALKRGLPPAMSANHEGAFWGTPCHSLAKPTKVIGCCNSGVSVPTDIRSSLSASCLGNPDKLAKDVACKLKGGFRGEGMYDNVRVCQYPPDLPNVYSDGGLSHPTSRTWSVGSFGVFWPNRDCSIMPLTLNESTFSHNEVKDFGAFLWGPLCGNGCSSTRAELAAGIIAMSGPGPIHLASDSSAFLKRARKFKGMLHRQTAVVKDPVWETYVDGDLWKILWRLMKQKGPSAIRFSKVKGHAGAKELRAGTSTLYDVVCNNESDKLATRGRVERTDMLGQLADFYARRQTAYVRFVVRVHNFQLRMLNIIAVARRAKQKQEHLPGLPKSVPKCDVASLLPYPAVERAGSLILVPLPDEVYAKLSDMHKYVLGFFVGHKWAIAEHLQQGASWTELLCLFFAQGGSESSLGVGPKHEAESRLSLRKLLVAFKKQCRAVLSKYLVPESQVFFKPNKFGPHRAKCLGFSNHMANVAGVPYLDTAQAQAVAKMLVSMRHSFTRASSELMCQGLLKLRWQKVSLRGAAPDSWSTVAVRALFPQLVLEVPLANRKVLICGNVINCRDTLVLQCPSCDKSRECGTTKLIQDAKWKAIACKWCKFARSSAKWRCSCGVPWYVCDTHAGIGHAAGNTKRHTVPKRIALDVPMPLAPKRARGAWDHHDNVHDTNSVRGKHVVDDVVRPKRGQKRKLSNAQQREDAIAAFERIRNLRKQCINVECDRLLGVPLVPPVSERDVPHPIPSSSRSEPQLNTKSSFIRTRSNCLVVKPLGKFKINRG
jgi:hypothetical protein